MFLKEEKEGSGDVEVRKQKVTCKSYPITYTLLIKQVKNINMRISKQGEIVVSANPYIPMEKIDRLVSDHIEWILKQKKNILNQVDKTRITDEYMYLLGEKVQVKISSGKYNRVCQKDHGLEVIVKDYEQWQGVIQSFLDKLSQKIFFDIAYRIYDQLQDYRIPFPEIKFRHMTSRWGSCMPSKRKITLNKKLIHYPIPFIEYVVLHEFVHFIQPNHSKAFYHIIQHYMPDYKQRISLGR